MDDQRNLLNFNEYMKYNIFTLYDYSHIIKEIEWLNETKFREIKNIFDAETLMKMINTLRAKKKLKVYRYYSIIFKNTRILLYCRQDVRFYYIYIPFYLDVSNPYNTKYLEKIEYVCIGHYIEGGLYGFSYTPKYISLLDKNLLKYNIIYIEDGEALLTFAIAFRKKYRHLFPPELLDMINNDYELYISYM